VIAAPSKPAPSPVVRTVSGISLNRSPDPGAEQGREKRCPVCGRQGRKVTALTVTAHLLSDYWDRMGDGFWCCWTPSCPILYYDNAREVYVSTDLREVRSRFAPKETTSHRPICYCLGITMDRILDEVVNRRCCDSLEDVERYTRAGTGKWCLITNPSGVCCRVYLKEVVAQAFEVARAGARPAVAQVARALEEADEGRVSAELRIQGMDCESCTLSVAAALEHAGAREVHVSLQEASARFERPEKTPLSRYVEAVADTGYTAASPNG
jgi:copper chaperone CopZ